MAKKVTRKTNKVLETNHCEMPHHFHPDHSRELVKLRRVKGQVDGLIRMIEDRRYCPDILIQVRAAKSALLNIEMSILKKHIEGCVQDALASKDPHAIDQKISELIEIIERHL